MASASGSRPARAEESGQAERDQAWRDGDVDLTLGQAHGQYRTRLEAVAYRILRSRPDAEDVVQRIFIALRNARFEGRASLWTYLYRAAVNGSVNVLRSRRRQEAAERRLHEYQMVVSEGRTARHDPEAIVLQGELMSGVARALLQVKPQHRRVLALRIMHGLSNTEIAEQEDLPLATVGTWLRRGRQELRRGLKPVLRELGRED